MKLKLLRSFFILVLSFILISPGLAQRQTGTLGGKTVDQDDRPLPGVTVTLESPTLMGTKDSITTEKGTIRFPALPPGVYTITCALDGFNTVRRGGIKISVGKTTTIEMMMEQARIDEEVIITAPSPAVDIKSSKSAVTYTKELLDNLPMNRSLFAFVQAAPGVISSETGQSAAGYGGITSAYGGSAANNTYMMDGLDFTNPHQGRSELRSDLDSFEEIEIEVGGHPAEVGRTPGIFVNIVSSSGGNDFHGRASIYYFNESFVDRNATDEELKAYGIGKPASDKANEDIVGTLGGPIIKDKLWFFLTGRYAHSVWAITNFSEDGEWRRWHSFGKLTFQVNKNMKLAAQASYDYDYVPNVDASQWRTIEATRERTLPSYFINSQLNWILSPDAFLDIRFMWLRMNQFYRARQDLPSLGTHQNQDWGTGVTSGYPGYGGYDEYYKRQRLDFSVSATVFKENFLGGDHEFKMGGGFERNYTHADAWMPVPIKTFSWYGSPFIFGPNVGLFTAYTYGDEEGVGDWLWHIDTWTGYVQDTWTIKDRLTLNLGLRFMRQRAFTPEQFNEGTPYWEWLDPVYFGRMDFPAYDLLTINSLAPRLGLTFDIFGNGKTIFKASYSRYYERLMHSHMNVMNPNSYANRQYVWIDVNWNGEIDPYPTDWFILNYSGGKVGDPKKLVDPNVKPGYWNEVIVGIEQELMPDFRAGMRFIYKHQPRVLEDIEYNMSETWGITRTATDPGFDGQLGTADDSQLMFYDRAMPFSYFWMTNPEGAFRKYRGLEFIFEKRMSRNWQLVASVTYSKTWGTIGQSYLESLGGGQAPFNTPNFLVNGDGRADADRPLVVKLQATYKLPFGINLSGFFVHADGGAYTRKIQIYAPNARTYVTVLAEPRGSRRYPAHNNLDMRLEKEFALGGYGRLGVFLDCYNVLNSFRLSTITDYHGRIEPNGSFTTSSNWMRIVGVNRPRFIKLGVRFSF